jgi:3-oxoadipate enol-lactonase
MTTITPTPSIHASIIDSRPRAPWLTMVHGFSHNHHYFSAQAAEFQADFRLFQVDLRGHGASAGMPGPFGIEEYADDLVAALDRAGIERTHYWGTHTGAAIGLVLALRCPERLASLVLEGTFLPGFAMPQVPALLERARSIATTRGLAAALADWFEHAGWFEYIRAHPQACRAEEHRQMVNAFQGQPWFSPLTPRAVTPAAGRLAEIALPTLAYNGASDMDDFRRAGEYLQAHLPNLRYEIIPDAGGFPAWENPPAVNRVVGDFLRPFLSAS